ncbi:MAG: choice-of-anchor Q domain-containing protein [Planctomycetota bacterium]
MRRFVRYSLGGEGRNLPNRHLRFEQLEDRRLLAITVDTLVDELDGSIVDGDISLRDAIAAAPANETIDFAVNGTLRLDASLGELIIDKNLKLDGPGAAQLTLDAQGQSRVLLIQEGATFELARLTLTDGMAARGGGILNAGALTIVESVVTGNRSSGLGGGIGSFGTTNVIRSTISDNTSGSSGSAIFSDGSLLIADSEIGDNDSLHPVDRSSVFSSGGSGTIIRTAIARNSGGVWNASDSSFNGGTLSLLHSTVADNAGTGVFARFSETVVRDSTISGNSAAYGGGLRVAREAHLSIHNSTIAENTASSKGGGLHTLGDLNDVISITNSTISQNTAQEGGGVYSQGEIDINHSTISGNVASYAGGIAQKFDFDAYYGFLTIRHSVISGNFATSGGPNEMDTEFRYLDSSLVGHASQTRADAINAGFDVPLGSPQLATSDGGVPTPLDEILDTKLADNGGPTLTHALIPGSPAVDAGDPNVVAGVGGVPLHDQRGLPFTRVFDGDTVPGARIDLGAVELRPLPETCDFDGDAACDLTDIDALVLAIAAGLHDPSFDLTADGLVDLADRDAWLAEAGAMNLPAGSAYPLGDANLDGRVDGQDFITWDQHKFSFTAAWSRADFNADGQTDGQDFVIWNSFKFRESDDEQEAGARRASRGAAGLLGEMPR